MTENVEEGRELLGKLDSLIQALVPEGGIVITTAAGTVLELPSVVPARNQIRAFRKLRELLERPNVQEAMRGMSGGDTASVVDGVVGLATDEETAECLAGIFSAAYPDVLKDQHPLDALPIEEIVKAVLPFSARFAGQLGAGLSGLMQLTE
tara:strand:+ start:282 stop:734 length:453 start_codon:yes stop_codon:yes gene_type:complete